VRIRDLDAVVVLSPDRLARDYVHQMVLIEELEKCGCRVEFVERSLYGIEGSDYLSGSTGSDFIDGASGDDIIPPDNYYTSYGKDTVYAGDGNDTITVTSDGAADFVDGGLGYDKVYYWCTRHEAIDQLQNIEYVATTCIG
jgi:hypothetical protein